MGEKEQTLRPGLSYIHTTMYDQILVPTDGSDGSEIAFEQALGLARTYSATVHLLYVVDPIAVGSVPLEMLEQELRQRGEVVVEQMAERAESQEVTAITELRSGKPAKEILEYVDENDIHLVVMGTHGRTGLDRYLIGSVTEKVVRLSDKPVLTVRKPTEDGE